ncbi:hypothetical protein LVJ94_38800 [Pendulispora rubella]|uniref:Uncharacterized protein n=1 Tax=Pendulispora rubella TaxID=2741070 RepID=A0ABZ2KVX5_9BACT
MRPQDTHPAAYQAQLEVYRRMSPERKSGIVRDLSESVRCLAREGIRQRHPEYSNEEVRRALIALIYGSALAQRLWPGDPVPSP